MVRPVVLSEIWVRFGPLQVRRTMCPEGKLSRTTLEFVSRVNLVVRPAASSIRVMAPNRSTRNAVVYPRGSLIRACTVSASGAKAGVTDVKVVGTPTVCQGERLSVGDTTPAPKIGTFGNVTCVSLPDG